MQPFDKNSKPQKFFIRDLKWLFIIRVIKNEELYIIKYELIEIAK